MICNKGHSLKQARETPGSTHPLFGASPIPIYVQLAELLRQRIDKGEWPKGTMLPSIEQLMADFDVARVTVRQAIQLLAQDGLLSPQRGRGTFVAGRSGPQRRLRVETSLSALVDMYRGDMPDLTHIEESDRRPVLLPDDGPAAPQYRYLRRLHTRDGERYCVISIFLAEHIFAKDPDRFRKEVMLPVLVEIEGLTIATARQTLAISVADAVVAQELGIAVNAPVANVRRILCDAEGTVIYLAEVTYRGDYIHLEMDLAP